MNGLSGTRFVASRRGVPVRTSHGTERPETRDRRVLLGVWFCGIVVSRSLRSRCGVVVVVVVGFGVAVINCHL
jgi:hypothetical protein